MATPLVRWALVFLMGRVAQGVHAFVEPMPSKEECPHCGFASWTCEASCSALLGIEFNFTHESDGCFEAIPADDRTLFWDTDAYCIFPESREVVGLTCDTMDDYVLNNPFVLFLDQCSLNTGSDITIVEACHWTCKAGRPYYRCKWTFDPEGKYTYNGVSVLEKCWLKETCTSTWNQRIEAVCRPMDLWKHAGLGMVLQENVELLGQWHTEAASELSEALTASGVSQQEIDAAWVRYNATVKELSDRAAAMAAAGKFVVDDTPYDKGMVITTVLITGIDAERILLLETSHPDNGMKQKIKEVIVSEAGPDTYSTGDVSVEFTRGSLVVKASMLTHSAVDATMLQRKLRDSSTLPLAILAALESTPDFASMTVGVTDVGSVSVEIARADKSKKDLQSEIEKYKELYGAEREKNSKLKEKHSEAVTTLLAAIGALCGLVVLLCVAVAVLCYLRKRTAQVTAEISETQNVVVGRPCVEDQERLRREGSGSVSNMKGGAGPWPRSPSVNDSLFGAGITAGAPVRPKSDAHNGAGVKGLDV